MLTKDELIYTVSFLTTEYIDKNGNIIMDGATGFFYKTKLNNKDIYLIVSNKHFFNNKRNFKFTMPFIKNGIDYNMNFSIQIDPTVNDDYDIGMICINDAINRIETGCYLKNKFIEDKDLYNISSSTVSPIEESLMIGYPFGIKSDNNTMPLIRQGVISTPLYMNYNNKEEFLIDIFCFNGSSGSPIFINKNDQYYLVGIERGSLKYNEINTGFGCCINSNIIQKFLNIKPI